MIEFFKKPGRKRDFLEQPHIAAALENGELKPVQVNKAILYAHRRGYIRQRNFVWKTTKKGLSEIKPIKD